jgi:hypothetical protein
VSFPSSADNATATIGYASLLCSARLPYSVQVVWVCLCLQLCTRTELKTRDLNSRVFLLNPHLLLSPASIGSPSLLHFRSSFASIISQGTRRSCSPPWASESPAEATSAASCLACESFVTGAQAVSLSCNYNPRHTQQLQPALRVRQPRKSHISRQLLSL